MYTTQEFPARSMNKHTTVLLPDFLRTCWVSSQQQTCLTKDWQSSRMMTPSIDLSYKKQQSSFASAKGVVPTKEYPSRSILYTTTLLDGFLRLPSYSKVSSSSLPHQQLASTKVLRISKWKEWWIYLWCRTEDEHTTLDFNQEKYCRWLRYRTNS